MSQTSDNFKAGLFVMMGMVLLLVFIFAMTDLSYFFAKTQAVDVRFLLRDGLKGLKVGAQVTIGDFPAGSVTKIEDDAPDANGQVVAKIVTVEIPERYRLYDNAVVELNMPPLGSGTKLNIRSIGYDATVEQEQALIVQGMRVIRLDSQGRIVKVPADLADDFTAEQIEAEGTQAWVDRAGRARLGESWEYIYADVAPLRGGAAPSQMVVDLVREIGIDEVQRAQIRNIITNVEGITTTLATRKEDVNQIVQDVAHVTGGLRQYSDSWWERIESITGSAKSALETADGWIHENEPVLTEAVAKGRDTMANAAEITEKFKTESMPKIEVALDRAREAIGYVKDTSEELRTVVTTQRPVLERMLANMRLSSDQLKLATIEIRRSPWRLLYKPGEKELETDNLYDAARSFALAAGTLESSADSLQSMLDKYGDEIDPNDENLKLMLENLQLSFERYTEAEKHFWDAVEVNDLK